MGEKIAKASKAVGALWELVFRDGNLSLRTKRKVDIQGYSSRSASVWLWNLDNQEEDVRRLEVFHNRCLK